MHRSERRCGETHPRTRPPSESDQNDQSSNDSLTSTSPREVEDLNNTSRPTTRLNHNMTFKEATTWIDNFYGWLERNKRVLDSRSLEQQRILLEDSLDVNMLSKLQRRSETPVRGPNGLLTRLRGYFMSGMESRCPGTR